MAVYRQGSKGPEVARIQARLAALGHYHGPIDGVFGGGTETAARAFQAAHGLGVDGAIGPASWAALFGDVAPEPAIRGAPLGRRCLALTGSFETSLPVPDCFAGLSGDFDGQGISFGALQWNLGQGSLQPMLKAMAERHREAFDAVFAADGPALLDLLARPRKEQLTWARGIQSPKHVLDEPWRGRFKTLGRTVEFQAIQLEASAGILARATDWCRHYGLRSQRALALMFDIRVQNGSIKPAVEALIRADFAALGGAPAGPGAETPFLRAIANRRAEAANPRWVEDVRRRKLTIAEGTGTVHGEHYDLEADFGIGLRDAGF